MAHFELSANRPQDAFMSERHLTFSIIVAALIVFLFVMRSTGAAHAIGASGLLIVTGIVLSIAFQQWRSGALQRWIVFFIVFGLAYQLTHFTNVSAIVQAASRQSDYMHL